MTVNEYLQVVDYESCVFRLNGICGGGGCGGPESYCFDLDSEMDLHEFINQELGESSRVAQLRNEIRRRRSEYVYHYYAEFAATELSNFLRARARSREEGSSEALEAVTKARDALIKKKNELHVPAHEFAMAKIKDLVKELEQELSWNISS